VLFNYCVINKIYTNEIPHYKNGDTKELEVAKMENQIELVKWYLMARWKNLRHKLAY
jgi:hypothetical protein